MKCAWASKGKMSLLYRSMNFITWLLFKTCYRLRIYGQEHVQHGSAVIAANHVSYLDPPLLGIACPEEVHYLAKNALFNIPLFGRLIKKINAHPLKGDAGDVAVLKLIIQLLEEHNKVILFPEGQRSYDDRLCPIKPGISLLVSKTKASIIPTYIFGTFRAWPRTKSFPKIGVEIGCVFGSPIFWEENSSLSKKEAQMVFADRLTTALSALKKWHEAGAQGSPP